MKKATLCLLVMIIAVLLMLLAFKAVPAYAEDGNNVPDQLGDIFSGKGNSYLGGELINIPLIGPFTGKAWFDVMAGKIDDGEKRDARGGLRAVADWQKIFK